MKVNSNVFIEDNKKYKIIDTNIKFDNIFIVQDTAFPFKKFCVAKDTNTIIKKGDYDKGSVIKVIARESEREYFFSDFPSASVFMGYSKNYVKKLKTEHPGIKQNKKYKWEFINGSEDIFE